MRHVPSPGAILACGNLYLFLRGADVPWSFLGLWRASTLGSTITSALLGYGAFGHVAYYAALWVPVGAVLLACRRWVLKRGSAAFAVGAAVEARWQDGLWYPGRISGAGSGSYEITFDDGHTEAGVRAAHVRSAAPAAPARTAKKSAKKAATPARVKKELPAVGDRVTLALDDEDGVVVAKRMRGRLDRRQARRRDSRGDRSTVALLGAILRFLGAWGFAVGLFQYGTRTASFRRARPSSRDSDDVANL